MREHKLLTRKGFTFDLNEINDMPGIGWEHIANTMSPIPMTLEEAARQLQQHNGGIL